MLGVHGSLSGFFVSFRVLALGLGVHWLESSVGFGV